VQKLLKSQKSAKAQQNTAIVKNTENTTKNEEHG